LAQPATLLWPYESEITKQLEIQIYRKTERQDLIKENKNESIVRFEGEIIANGGAFVSIRTKNFYPNFDLS
jgi:hypothetical protein